MDDKCLGPSVKRSAIIIKKCPQCVEEVEMFTDEKQVTCSK
jgi:hypothetical protein